METYDIGKMSNLIPIIRSLVDVMSDRLRVSQVSLSRTYASPELDGMSGEYGVRCWNGFFFSLLRQKYPQKG